jgi:ribosomal protein S12 methylthiotransferase accessory factor
VIELRDRPPTPLAEACERLLRAVSPLTGIVRSRVELACAPDEPRLVTVSCLLASALPTLGAATVDHAGSAAASPEAATAGALGEALERYSGAHVPVDRLVVATAAELGELALDPARCALFHPRQYEAKGFPFTPFDASVRLRWIDGVRLDTGRPAFVPAQLALLHPPVDDEPRIAYSTSNGLACGPTTEEALLAALLEVVERDAVMLTWANRLSLPLLTWDDDPATRARDERYFAPTGIEYRALDGSAFFGLPLVIGLVRGAPGGRREVALGAACKPTVAAAFETALSEAFGVRRWMRDLRVEEPDRAYASPLDVTTFEDHLAFYWPEERVARTAFLDASPVRRSTATIPPIPGETPLERLRWVVGRLARANVSTYAVDVTSPDVADLGLAVVRVVCPELCALDVLGAAPYRGGTRLYRAAYGAGLVERPLDYDDLNPLPHPFP